MYVKYGTYTHDQNEVALASISQQVQYTETGIATGYIGRYTLRGVKHAADIDALTTALAALETAYSTNGYDFGLYKDDQATLTRHAITSANTRGGVKVMDMRYPEGQGAEYTTYRSYEIDLEWEVVTVAPNIFSWVETLSFMGGGSQWAFLPVINGTPHQQTLRQQIPYQCRQSGQAVGYFTTPQPQPYFPDAEHTDQREISPSTPQFLVNGNRHYPVSWSFFFESTSPFPGQAPVGQR